MQHVHILRCFFRETSCVSDHLGTLKAEKLDQGIEINNISFAYKNRNNILADVSVKINKGDKVLFIGQSGVGKTTLLKLIAALYQVENGHMMWNGIDYKDISYETIRDRIGYVFQETYLFGGSILENIRIGRFTATDEEIYEVAQKACVDEFVKDLPDKYETRVGERGALLSGGQRQRIAIARLMLKNPDVIILDEATSSLDMEAEKTIMENIFYKVFNDKTIIAVSHRASTFSYFERILYIDKKGIRKAD